MKLIYLDNNATTAIDPAVVNAMLPYLGESYGNPASAHAMGRRARKALDDAVEAMAALLGAHPDEVILTSGATESNNLAIFGLAGEPPGRVVVSPIEHPSVSEPAAELSRAGHEVDHLRVDSQGVVQKDSLARLIRQDLRLVAIMMANNETGAIQPIADLAGMVGNSTYFHCDATQAVSRLPISFRDLGVSTLSFSGHKFHGPKGIGALLVRRGLKLQPQLWGGHQQRGQRPGTQPVALAVGLAAALEIAVRDAEARRTKVVTLRQRFLEELSREAAPWVLNGPAAGGVPHTLNLSFPGCAADVLLMNLDLLGVACSTGSACSSGSLLPSPVLKAMGLPPDLLASAMRFSLSHMLTEEDVAEAARRIGSVVRRLRAS